MSSMDSEQFFLKWNNFESNLASGFADLLQKEAMVDVTLAAEGKIVQAHKIILSICSSYFKSMFQVNPCQHPIVVLKDVRYQELTDMLDFMYKGEANVRQEDLPSFLKLAETLRVKGLAGNQGELDESSISRNSESQISNLTKDSLPFVREEPSNELLYKVSLARKKAKRSTSPLVYSETKDLPQSPNIKLEMEECDDNFLRNSENNCGQNAVMKEERLGDISLDSYGENHVVHESIEVEKIAGPSNLDENPETAPQETVPHTRNFSFVESCFGGRLLILGGYSYRRKSMTTEKSYWFCCSTKCPAKGILDADGEFQMTHPAHNHKPDFEKIKRKEKLVELKKLALQRNVSGQELLDALNIKDDVKKNLGFIRTCRRRDKKRHSISTQAPLNAGLNYKMLPSRIPSKEMLFHSGCLFRQDSRNPRNEKCKYWRCRVKKCKARAKTDDFGNLTILKSLHNHPVEETEETLKYFPEMIKNESSIFQKQVAERVSECRAKKENLKTFDWKVGKQTKRRKEEKFRPGKVSDSVAYDPNQVFCPSATDTETFSLEKLITDTLAENYCVTPEFGDSINLLKSSENPR